MSKLTLPDIFTFILANKTRGGFIGGCTGVRTPVGPGQQGCKGGG